MSDWINAKNLALVPDSDRYVLVCTETKKGSRQVKIGYYTPMTGWVVGMNNNVIAWMELPDPPEEGD